MKILLTPFPKRGSTDEVAAVIAEWLRAAHIDVETRRPEDVDGAEEYDTSILDSAVYMTTQMPEAIGFTTRFHDVLRAGPVWTFPVGLFSLPRGKVSDPTCIDPALLVIDPEDHMTFAGRLDPSKLNLWKRPIAKLEGTTKDDYRDWNEVRQWADTIATFLYDDMFTSCRDRP